MFARRIAQQVKSFQFLKRQDIWAPTACQKCGLHSDSGLALQYAEDVAIITMDNGKDNRINGHFLKEFIYLLDSVKGNTSCKALVTTGNSKFYSNGLNLDWMATISTQELLDFMADFQRALHSLLTYPLPTLAAVNGHAFAGGAVLAFTHDLRTMNSEKGWICFNEVHLNKKFSRFLKDYLRIKLGGGKNVSDALVLGRRYTGDDSYHNHLVHASHPGISLLNHSLQILQSFTQREGIPREGMSKMKHDIYELPLLSYEKELSVKHPEFAVQFMTEAQRTNLEKL